MASLLLIVCFLFWPNLVVMDASPRDDMCLSQVLFDQCVRRLLADFTNYDCTFNRTRDKLKDDKVIKSVTGPVTCADFVNSFENSRFFVHQHSNGRDVEDVDQIITKLNNTLVDMVLRMDQLEVEIHALMVIISTIIFTLIFITVVVANKIIHPH